MKNNIVYLILFFSILFFGCKPDNISLSEKEQNQIIVATINIERDSSLGIINGAKYGSYYLLNAQFDDSIYIDSNIINLFNKNISSHDIEIQYKKELKKSNRLVTDSFNLISVVEFSNKIPVFLSFSKPIKYLKYYIIGFSYSSWSSGYKSILLLEKSTSGQFKLIYRKVYEIV